MASIFCRYPILQNGRDIARQVTGIVRSVSTSPSTIRTDIDEDMPVDMEDPFKPITKRCFLCGVRVDYKNVQLLSQFVSSYTGLPVTQKLSGLCDAKYDVLLKSIKLSQRAGYMAFRTKETTFLEDPDITGTVFRSRTSRSGSKSLPSKKPIEDSSNA